MADGKTKTEKDFGRKEQLKSTKPHDRDYFCDTLDEIMLVREAVEFNSSMKPKNVREFYMAFMVSWFEAKLDEFTKCFYSSVPEL